MSRPPLWRRLLDTVALLACFLTALSGIAAAFDAEHWPFRITAIAVAIGLGVFTVRATPMLVREWRAHPNSQA